jgi:hypothetical protein
MLADSRSRLLDIVVVAHLSGGNARPLKPDLVASCNLLITEYLRILPDEKIVPSPWVTVR